MTVRTILLTFWIFLVLLNPASAAPLFRLTDLGTLPGQSTSHAYSINNLGQVVGNSIGTNAAGDIEQHAVLWSSGSMMDLGNLGGNSAVAHGINDTGQIIGVSTTSPTSSTSHGFYYESGSMTDIGTLAGVYAVPYGINNQGQVAGVSDGQSFLYSANAGIQPLTNISGWSNALAINNLGHTAGNLGGTVMYHDGTTTHDLGGLPGFIPPPPFDSSTSPSSAGAYAINDYNQITGYSSIGGSGSSKHAFMWDNNVWTDLGSLGGDSYGYGINNAGHVVGWSADGTSFSRDANAFIYTPEEGMLDLNNLLIENTGWLLEIARDINEAGQIVGYGISPTGQTRAFLLDPVPIPGAIWLFGSGLLGLVGLARCKKAT